MTAPTIPSLISLACFCLVAGLAGCTGPAGAADAVDAGLRFTLVAGQAGGGPYSSPGAAWADYDGDGDPDLLVLNGYATYHPETPQPDFLYRNDDGVLTPVADHPLVRDPDFDGAAVWADYDNDGDLDVFVANQRDAPNRLYRSDDGAFSRVAGPWDVDGGRSFSAAWVDVDGDGRLDLHVLNGRDGDGGQPDFLYRNVGGGFQRVRGLALVDDTLPSGGATWADYDGDGDPDLFLPVQSTGTTNRLFRNDGDLRFTEVAGEAGLSTDPLPYSPASSAARWVDYDGDGDLDLFVGTTGAIDLLYRNDGGHFTRTDFGRIGLDATYVSDITWVDLDNDVDLDLVIAVWGGGSEIYRNNGTGLVPAEAGDFGRRINFGSSIAAADYDGDGDLDLYLTQWPVNEAGGMPNELYRNDTAAGHWLDVALDGRASNRSGIGASIEVTATMDDSARTQLRVVTSRTSWRAAGPLARHFGLAGATHVDRVRVTWPSGRVDTLAGPIPVDRQIRVVEGEGPPPR